MKSKCFINENHVINLVRGSKSWGELCIKVKRVACTMYMLNHEPKIK